MNWLSQISGETCFSQASFHPPCAKHFVTVQTGTPQRARRCPAPAGRLSGGPAEQFKFIKFPSWDILYIYVIIGILFNDILYQIPKFKMESIINVMGYYRWQLEKFTCLDDNYIDISRNFFFDGVVQRSSWKCVMINSWGSLEPKSYVDRRYGIITKPRSLEASKPRSLEASKGKGWNSP